MQMQYTIDFSGPIKDHRGNALTDFHLLVADTLVVASQGSYAKHMYWAMQLVESKTITVDSGEDLAHLQDFFGGHDKLTHLAKFRIMEQIEKAKAPAADA